jgi:putative ABC transport system permease protein
MVTTDYFRTMRIPVMKGRGFSLTDGPDAPSVVVINESLSRQIWPRGDAIGKQIVVDYSTAGTYPYEVVGIVKDVRFHGLRSKPRPEIYFHHPQRPYLILNIAVRTANDPRLLIAPVRKVLHTIDPQKPPHNVTQLEDLVDATVVRDRYAMMLVSVFAIVALMLALLGIYGVLAFYVRQRVQEIGVRMALGAQQSQIVSWIVKHGAILIVVGVIAGLFASILFARLLTGVLYEISPFDVWSLVIAALALIIAAFAATWIPARRAARIDPSIALRYE